MLRIQPLVLCREVVLFRRLFCMQCVYRKIVLCREVCPLSEVILYAVCV